MKSRSLEAAGLVLTLAAHVAVERLHDGQFNPPILLERAEVVGIAGHGLEAGKLVEEVAYDAPVISHPHAVLFDARNVQNDIGSEVPRID